MIIGLVLLALISSYSEVLRLIETGRWTYNVTYIKSWGLGWTGFKRFFDSFHLPFGLYTLLMCIMLTICAECCAFCAGLFHIVHFGWAWNTIAQVIALWWFFFWIRNIGMHIIWMRKGYRRWKYLLPIHF